MLVCIQACLVNSTTIMNGWHVAAECHCQTYLHMHSTFKHFVTLMICIARPTYYWDKDTQTVESCWNWCN